MRFRNLAACLILGLVIAPGGAGLPRRRHSARDPDWSGPRSGRKGPPRSDGRDSPARKRVPTSIVTDASRGLQFPAAAAGSLHGQGLALRFPGLRCDGERQVCPGQDHHRQRLAEARGGRRRRSRSPARRRSWTRPTPRRRPTVESTLTQKLAVGRSYQTLITFAPGVTVRQRLGQPELARRLEQQQPVPLRRRRHDRRDDGHLRPELQLRGDPGGQHLDLRRSRPSTAARRAPYVNVITKSGTNQLHGSFKVHPDQRRLELAEQGDQP